MEWADARTLSFEVLKIIEGQIEEFFVLLTKILLHDLISEHKCHNNYLFVFIWFSIMLFRLTAFFIKIDKKYNAVSKRFESVDDW